MQTATLTEAEQILERRLMGFRGPHVFESLERLAEDLAELRRALDAASWQRVVERCREGHPLLDRIRRAPVCGRSFEKPRGYAGDAETLDYIYGVGVETSTWPKEVRDVHAWERRAPASRSVRIRREALGAILDEEATRRSGLRALSVACGHLREAGASRALANGRVERLYALDQDRRSLDRIAADNPGEVVVPVQGSVRHLLGRRLDLEPLDLIWSAGLYDYLEPAVGAALTRRLFGMLAPGGRLVVVNFTPDLRDIGFMEAVMDWQLVYRREADMLALAAGIDADQVQEARVWRDPEGNLVYLDLRRREAVA